MKEATSTTMDYIKTIIPFWGDGKEVCVQIDSSKSLPSIEIIWLADNAIKESKERLRATFRHCNIQMPARRFIINLAPSNLRKNGTLCDIAIAVWLLLHIYPDVLHTRPKASVLFNSLFFWELWLDGSIKDSPGIFAWVLIGIKLWYTQFFVPAICKEQCASIPNITIYAVDHFSQIVSFLLYNKDLPIAGRVDTDTNADATAKTTVSNDEVSFEDIIGHEIEKRALAIAVAWMHNVIMIGPPWWWKSMLAKATRSLLPPLSFDEILEVSYLYSLSWQLIGNMPLITSRPFRTIHSTTSKIALIWWGVNALPWELSLAHKGILFFDELAEFPREILDSLRQPLEDKCIHISRIRWKTTYPAHNMFLGAMNPCVCWYYGDTYHTCRCSLQAIKRYQSKISWPLLDRMDMVLSIDNKESGWFFGNTNKSSTENNTIKAKIAQARDIQKKRYENTPYTSNSDVSSRDIPVFMPLSEDCTSILHTAVQKLHFSLRVIHKTIKVARSIADYDNIESIQKEHILEALQYRSQARLVKE